MRHAVLGAVAFGLGVFSWMAPAGAGTLTLDGELTQGGLVLGTTDPGAAVSVDGRAVRVSANGRFVFGFGRDARPTAALRVDHPDGTRTVRELMVEQRTYQIQRIDGLPARQVSPGPRELARIKEDNAQIAAVRRRDTEKPFFASGFAWPATGPLSGVFGSQRILNGNPRSPHNGVDIAVPKGTPVAAAADGVVALAHSGMFYTGKTVMIDHGHGLTSVYVHMDDIHVANGQRVGRGVIIGTVGKTGRATAPHLHWGITLFGTHLDPALAAGPMPR